MTTQTAIPCSIIRKWDTFHSRFYFALNTDDPDSRIINGMTLDFTWPDSVDALARLNVIRSEIGLPEFELCKSI